MDKSTTTPRYLLALLLLTAALVLGAGVVLSRREVAVRRIGERGPLIEFGETLQNELRRLEGLHERHLELIARNANFEDRAQLARDCEEVVGIVRCSSLFRISGRQDQHVNVGPVRTVNPPFPALELPATVKPSDFMVLDPKQFLDASGRDHGWIERAGAPLVFWLQRNAGQLRVLTIEPRDVRLVLNKAIREWLTAHGNLIPSWGDQTFTTPDGESILITDRQPAAKDSPDWMLPMRTHYGTWMLSAWDRVEVQRSFHKPTLIMAAALAGLIASLGAFIYFQHRRTLRQAAERVSFVNRVTHELRTPLTNIVLNLDVASEALEDDSPQATQRLALVREEAGRLTRLIDNVLAFSRREQGHRALRVVGTDPEAVVDDVLTQFTAAFQRRNIRVKRERNERKGCCELDPDALAQITSNLFANVEKYAPAASVVVSTLFDDDGFTLSVADTGPGIPPTDRDRIFLPFERLNSRTNEGTSGTGLGLSIARDLAEQMGGELCLENSAQGARFVFRLKTPTLPKP